MITIANKLDQVYNDLVAGAERLGLTPPRYVPRGSTRSQTYEFYFRAKPLMLLAIRSVAQESDYAGGPRLWVEGIDTVIARYQELLATNPSDDQLPPAFAVVLDNQADSLVSVSLRELIVNHLRRIREVGAESARFTFMLRRRKTDYVLEGVYGGPDTVLAPFKSVQPLVEELRGLLAKETSRARA